MRKLLIGLAAVALIAFAGYQLLGERIAMRAMAAMAERGMSNQVFNELEDGLHVMLCGAGSPLPDPVRSGPCVLVVAGQQVFVVDAGSGAVRNLGPAGFAPGLVSAVLLTHFHSDHIDGLGELAMQRWAGGHHDEPLPVYGPTGVKQVVAGFNTAYGLDFGYRVAHHGADTVNPSGAGSRAVEFAAPAPGEAYTVLERDGLKITAFAVEHPPIAPAVGYRFDYRGRSVLISGDTKKSANLQAFAEGVDLLVHEALAPDLVAAMTQAAEKAGAAHMATILRDILDYHTTPVEAAEIARDAGVGHLLYYHIVPALPLKPMEKRFTRGVAEVFDGEVTVGRDGNLINLPAAGRAIEVSNALPL